MKILDNNVLCCAQRASYDHDVIMNKCLGFYDVKSNKKYIFYEP